MIPGLSRIDTGYAFSNTLPLQQNVEESSNFSDKVSVSDEALAASRANKTSFSPENRWTSLRDAAHSGNESDADNIVSQMAYASDGVLVSLKDWPTLRHSNTGQIVTKEDMNYFNSEMGSVRQGRIQLYESEKEKGTPAADIMDKMLAYMDSLPMKYQILAGVKLGKF